jgi:peptidoglycan/LPS O-acetylase OafA/YrhL
VSVLVFHASTTSGFSAQSRYWSYTRHLDFGVTVFFLISGFLLYRPFAVSHLTMSASPATGRFWIRRLLRIVPAYWLALTIITYVLHDAAPGKGVWGVIAVYGFGQIYFPKLSTIGIGQAWTLCVELSFYLFLPIYGMIIAFRRSSPKQQFVRELVGLTVLAAGGYAFRTMALLYPPCPKSLGLECVINPPVGNLARNWLPSYLAWFVFGMALAVASAWLVERRREISWLAHPLFPWACWFAAGATYWWIAHLQTQNTNFPKTSLGMNLLNFTLAGLCALLLLLPAVFGPQEDGFIRWLLRSWVFASVGVISYGIYLWHTAWIAKCLRIFGFNRWGSVPALLFLVLCVLALSIASASASYFALERPILKFKSTIGWWKRRSTTGQTLRSLAPADLESES